MEYTIRRINKDEVEDALALAWEVFLQFEAPDYGEEGVKTFRKDIIENVEYIAQCKQGSRTIYGAFDQGILVAIIGMNTRKDHIDLVFTKRECQRKGISSAIFRYILTDLRKEKPEQKEITLNSSPYGVPFYLHLGFIPLSEEQEKDGIRYTPMKYVINK